VTDAEGRPLRLFQASPDGRYGACYTASDEPYPSDKVYVDGVACWAREAHFGGIVVQAM